MKNIKLASSYDTKPGDFAGAGELVLDFMVLLLIVAVLTSRGRRGR